MGMYTGIRFKGIIKEEYTEVIETMMGEGLNWEELYVRYPQYEFLNEFGKISRSHFIPYGSLAYMPETWESGEYPNEIPTDGFDTKFDNNARVWSFQCSLKNYEDEIGLFFKIVLPVITEEIIHLEYYYEEWNRSRFYELKNGEIVESDREGILYGYEEEDYYWGY